MGARARFVIPLVEVVDEDEPLVGGKAARLAALGRAGFTVPGGFCITIDAYQHFLNAQHLGDLIRMELGRKSFEDMRWEEIWDASLRIRSVFNGASVPDEIASDIAKMMESFPADTRWAVRSTAPGEDSAQRSFAGLHESYLNVIGFEDMVSAVRLVWASLWSDAAMLYRRELALDPARSSMAVLVQPIRSEPVSGVAFGREPQQLQADHALIEAVPGLCAGLVDGEIDPDRWKLRRSNGEILDYTPGRREDDQAPGPLLEPPHLQTLNKTLVDVESLFSWPPDVEWTGRGEHLTLLQARPITAPAQEDPDDKRGWYLTLRPGGEQLRKLHHRVAEELIPELQASGESLAAERLENRSDEQLAEAIDRRLAEVSRWRKIYWDEFIPFAHGVRRLATYYNDAVRPEDPYEFVTILSGEPLLASRRNEAIAKLADTVRGDPQLRESLTGISTEAPRDVQAWRQSLLARLEKLPSGERFARHFMTLLDEHLDIAYDADRLAERPDLIVQHILELVRSEPADHRDKPSSKSTPVAELEERLMKAVGPERHAQAREVLDIGRISWRLRDNDNLLLARIEAQLLRAVHLAAERLQGAGRLEGTLPAGENAAATLSAGLRSTTGTVTLPVPEKAEAKPTVKTSGGETPRQLIGQPAAPGLQTARVRRIRSAKDLGTFEAGEILVCDGIQPMMTHLVPLAAAVVERRGGMLIHGAIIARELGIPCVNGVADVVDVLKDGDVVTVDGHLGIVTVGEPEFDMELSNRAGDAGR